MPAAHAEWYTALQRRQGRWPDSAGMALARIDAVRGALVEAEYIRPQRPLQPPPYWQWNLPMPNALGLEVVFRSDRERAEYERDREAAREVQRTLHRRCYEPAARAWDDIAPIIQAESRLADTLLWFSDRPFREALPRIASALRGFTTSLALYERRGVLGRPVEVRQPVADYLIEIRQAWARLHDLLRDELIRRLIAGSVTAEEAEAVKAWLDAEAASGAWVDPEADIARIEAHDQS